MPLDKTRLQKQPRLTGLLVVFYRNDLLLMAELALKSRIIFAKPYNTFNQTYQSRNACPTEKNIDNTSNSLADIEMLNANTTKKNSQYASGNFIGTTT